MDAHIENCEPCELLRDLTFPARPGRLPNSPIPAGVICWVRQLKGWAPKIKRIILLENDDSSYRIICRLVGMTPKDWFVQIDGYNLRFSKSEYHNVFPVVRFDWPY